jgi:type IV pilus assembly protein PilB
MARKRLGEILIQAGVLDNAGLHTALSEQRRWGGPLGRTLIDLQLVTEDELVRALSAQLKFPIADIENLDIPTDVLALVPAELAEERQLIPFRCEGKFLDVAMIDPTDLGTIDELRIRTQLNVRSYLAGPRIIDRAIARWYGGGVWDEHARMPEDHPDGELLPDRSGRPLKADRDAEIQALQSRISTLEALVSRDESVLRKLLGLLVEKGVATRDEILERLR